MINQEQTDFIAHPDICRGRHGGNEESENANKVAEPGKNETRERVFHAVVAAKDDGLTCKELATRWGLGMHQISGRFSELKRDGRIEKIGTRNRCEVYKVVKQ